jgi:hypothetical protein
VSKAFPFAAVTPCRFRAELCEAPSSVSRVHNQLAVDEPHTNLMIARKTGLFREFPYPGRTLFGRFSQSCESLFARCFICLAVGESELIPSFKAAVLQAL